MATKTKPIEERVAALEREVAALRAGALVQHTPSSAPGFAEEAQPGLEPEPVPKKATKPSLEERVARLEADVADLKGKSYKQAMLDQLGLFKDDPGYDDAMRLGREWRRRENKRR